MPPLSPTLILFTLIIIVGFLINIVFSISLYKYLKEVAEKLQRLIDNGARGSQPTIISKLKDRFKTACDSLDQINTAALIEQAYSQEKMWNISIEKIEHLCRTMPNLLLALGLLGTFIGITETLGSLNETLSNSSSSTINDLVGQIKESLSGMSTAFVTSLVGLFFSALITISNWLLNTGALKYQVLSSLEDYLDNIYLPEIQGDTRLDRIVNRMVQQQDEFLSRFGVTVRQAVETSMARVAEQIIEGNRESTRLARRVYERFTEVAGTISAAANEFENAINQLSDKSQIFKQAAEIFASSKFPERLSEAADTLRTIEQNFSQSAVSLVNTSQSFDLYVHEFVDHGTQIINANKKASEILELNRVNQNSLAEIIPQLQQGAHAFSRVVTRLTQLEENIVEKAQSLQQISRDIQVFVESVNNQGTTVNQAVSNISQEVINGFNESATKLDELEQNLLKKAEIFSEIVVNLKSINEVINNQTVGFQGALNAINNIHQEINGSYQKVSEIITSSNSTLVTEYKSVGDVLLEGVNAQTSISKESLKSINKDLQICIQYVYDAKNELHNLNRALQETQSQGISEVKDQASIKHNFSQS